MPVNRLRDSRVLRSLPSAEALGFDMSALRACGKRKARPGKTGQARYYDFNVFTSKKRIEKLKYIHRNPVKRGLLDRPEDWAWSSFRHYVTGASGIVEIESPWTKYYRTTKGPGLAKTGLERGTQIS
jgi:putative transposase